MGCSYHDTCVAVVVTGCKGKCRYRHQCVVNSDFDSVCCQNACCCFCEYIALDTAVIADGYRLVSALCFYPVCKTLCCLTYYIDIHTVCSCAKYTTKSCGSEFQRYSKTVLDLLIVSFNPCQLRVQICVFQISCQPSLILFQIHVFISPVLFYFMSCYVMSILMQA